MCHTLRGCVDWNGCRFIYQLITMVTPCVGVWIETYQNTILKSLPLSHPAWVCGLKPGMENNKQSNTVVTPCVGVWIETVVSLLPMKLIEVTPCVGVWIETSVNETSPSIILSHPAWVCGLKPWNLLNQNTQLPSHPAWVCGLKQLWHIKK